MKIFLKVNLVFLGFIFIVFVTVFTLDLLSVDTYSAEYEFDEETNQIDESGLIEDVDAQKSLLTVKKKKVEKKGSGHSS